MSIPYLECSMLRFKGNENMRYDENWKIDFDCDWEGLLEKITKDDLDVAIMITRSCLRILNISL